MDLNESFYVEVIEALSKSNVDFMLVGGMAVGIHGYPRYTGDMDLWLRPSHENMTNLKKALNLLGYDSKTIDSILSERPFNHPTPIRIFDEQDLFKVDLMTDIFYDKLSFNDCYSESEIFKNERVSLRIINIDHLIEIKQNVKRYDDNSFKDLNDAEQLKTIHGKTRS